MKRNSLISLVLASGLMLGGATAALAASGNDPHELAALMQAKTSMEQAITIAQNTTGGKVVQIAFGKDHGQYIYRIRTLSKDGMDKVAIDAASGRVLTVASAMPAAKTGSSGSVFGAPEYQPDHS